MGEQVEDVVGTTAEHPGRAGGPSRFAGIVGIIVGALMVIGGIAAWVGVTVQLSEENITVAEDAAFLQGAPVTDPLSAWAQAEVIQKHTLELTGGQTYAELDQDDPLRETAATASYLRTSLFTSIVAFGVALLAAGTGAIAILYGWSLLALGRRST
ncbi:aromatic ring-opening dioxygenase LigA [Agromyces humi]|uniref:aromatic ring-opening dioxygenase LigA n=1 Tax=Agromyces humi TaxID=1766800 RepID=UPI001F459BE5|nr:aromatic ring-opening dioxygenase LigA [Agromyces humi]